MLVLRWCWAPCRAAGAGQLGGLRVLQDLPLGGLATGGRRCRSPDPAPQPRSRALRPHPLQELLDALEQGDTELVQGAQGAVLEYTRDLEAAQQRTQALAVKASRACMPAPARLGSCRLAGAGLPEGSLACPAAPLLARPSRHVARG